MFKSAMNKLNIVHGEIKCEIRMNPKNTVSLCFTLIPISRSEINIRKLPLSKSIVNKHCRNSLVFLACSIFSIS